jgi:hypothetical protein
MSESPGSGDGDQYDLDEIRSVQGSKFFKLSLPKEYADEYDLEDEEVRMLQSGKFLMVRPATEDEMQDEDPLPDPPQIDHTDDYLILSADPDSETTKSIELPEETEELIKESQPSHDDTPPLERFMSKMLQSLIISGMNEIRIEDFDEDSNIAIRKALDAQRDPNMGVNMDTGEISIGEVDDPESYLREVGTFLELNLIEPLKQHVDETGGDQFQDTYNDILRNGKPEEIDRSWCYSTRQTSNRFLDLQYSYFPEEFCKIYVDKYCEMSIDITNRLIKTLADLEDSDLPDESVDNVKAHLREVLTIGEDYDEQMQEVAEKSYSLEVTPEDYSQQLNIYNRRTNKIERIRDSDNQILSGEEIVDPESDQEITSEDLEKFREFSVKVGEIFTLTERLIRFPRSIVLPGIVSDGITQVHGLNDK